MITRAREILNKFDMMNDEDVSEKHQETVILKKAVNGFTIDGMKVKVPKGSYSLVGDDEDRGPNVLVTDSDYEIFSISRKAAGVK